MKDRTTNPFALALALALSAAFRGDAAPFEILAPSELRADFTVSWSDFSTTHGTAVPSATTLSSTDGGLDITVVAEDGDLSIWNQGGLFTPGVLLTNDGPGRLILNPHAPVQGFGITIEHLFSVNAEYHLEFYNDAFDLLGTVSTPSPGSQGNPAWIGMVDPEARIAFIAISGLPGNSFVVTDATFQIRPEPETDPANLPVSAQMTKTVSNTATYLHEGRGIRNATPETTQATVDNVNVCDLRAAFPSLRGGDILRFERIGISLKDSRVNHVLCVLSKDETIAAGNQLHRVPGAIDAGTDFYTPQKMSGTFPTPTNIAQDFIVGGSTFITVPPDANYAMFSLGQPAKESRPVRVRLSHIERTQFLDWLAAFGLHGALAAPDHDLDDDELTLIEEFAFGKNPTVADSGIDNPFAFAPRLVPSPPGATGPLAIEFVARIGAPLRYRPEVSTDLLNWLPIPESSIRQLPLSADGMRILIATDEDAGPRRFGRVGVEYLPRP